MIKPSCVDTVIIQKRNLRNGYYSFRVGPYRQAGHCRPGQFVHVQLPSTDILFRRAMSVAAIDTDQQGIEIIFKVSGRGTTIMGKMRPGDRINLLGPIG